MAKLFGYRYQLSIGNKSEFLNLVLAPGDISGSQKKQALKGGVGATVDSRTSGLRISFLVNHDFGGALSTAEISVYNLTHETEEKIFKSYRSITLQAGWPEMFGAIFKGQIVNYQRIPGTNEGTRGIRLFCQSLGTSEVLKLNFVNKTFSKNTEIVEIIRYLASSLENPVQIIGDFSTLPKRSGATTLKNDARVYLNEYAQEFGFQWSVENGLTKVLKNGTKTESEIFLFTPSTGMIGSPVVTDTEVNVRVALNPLVKLGGNVQVKSTAPEFAFSGAYFVSIPRSIGEGVFQVRRIAHVGDSYSAVWETQLGCFRLADLQRESIAERATQ